MQGDLPCRSKPQSQTSTHIERQVTTVSTTQKALLAGAIIATVLLSCGGVNDQTTRHLIGADSPEAMIEDVRQNTIPELQRDIEFNKNSVNRLTSNEGTGNPAGDAMLIGKLIENLNK
jgi:hypothetical protein